MVNRDDRKEQLGKVVRSWALSKKANLSLASYEREIEALKILTGLEHTPNLLEIGSGNGLFLVSAATLGFADTGIGFDPGNADDGTSLEDIRQTQGAVSDLGLANSVRFEQRTFSEMLASEPSERYSMIIFRNSLHHIYERRADGATDKAIADRCVQDLTSLHRFLADDGVLCVLEATRPSPAIARIVNVYRGSKGAGPIQWDDKRTKSEWIELLQASGFRNTVSANRPYNKWIGNPIVRTAGTRFSPQFLVAARR
jgi:SAM-dependent methyltransferase